MDFSTIKLVATDMDGTLLNTKHELSNQFYPIFHQLKAKGVLFSAASGRQYHNLFNRFKEIQEDVIFVAENGSYVVHKGVDVLVQAMEYHVTKEQLIDARKINGAHIILCGKKKAYIEDNAPQFVDHVKMYYDKVALVDDLMNVEDDQFLKIAIYDPAGAEGNSYSHFRQKRTFLQVKVSGVMWLDISHRLATKGKALEAIQKRHGITTNETMVFGDYLNDLEMFDQAHFSFAMENAHPEVKKAARFVTKSNNENGVLEVLQKVLTALP